MLIVCSCLDADRTGYGQADLLIVSGMQLFDNWWERLASAARYAPVLITVFGLVVCRTMGYNWE